MGVTCEQTCSSSANIEKKQKLTEHHAALNSQCRSRLLIKNQLLAFTWSELELYIEDKHKQMSCTGIFSRGKVLQV